MTKFVEDLWKFYTEKHLDFYKAFLSMAGCRKNLDDVIHHIKKYVPDFLNKLERLISEAEDLYFQIDKEKEKNFLKTSVIDKLKDFQNNLYRSGKFNTNEGLAIEEYEEKGFLFCFKIFKAKKETIPVKVEIGEVKLTEDERLCYCICENYIEEFEKVFKI